MQRKKLDELKDLIEKKTGNISIENEIGVLSQCSSCCASKNGG